MNISEFITKSFALRNTVHLVHLTTESYALHKASGTVYAKWIELVDSFVEKYTVLPLAYTAQPVLALKVLSPNELVYELDAVATWLATDCTELAGGDAGLLNIIADMQNLVNQFLFELTLK